MLRLRLRGPGGKNHTASLPDGASLAQLRQEAAQAFSLPEAEVELLLGFPPALCTVSADAPLSSLLKSGDTATVRQATGAPATQASSSEAFASAPAPAAPAAAKAAPPPAAVPRAAGGGSVASVRNGEPWECPACTLENLGQAQRCAACEGVRPGTGGVAGGAADIPAGAMSAQLVQMPDDNSCLFHGLVYLLDPFKPPSALRQMVATEVRGNPVKWDAATLGKTPNEYVDYILDPIRWGGQVELAIMSSAYKAEIGVMEVQSGRCDVYGEGSGYTRRVYLLHSGIHFDAVQFGEARAVPPSGFADAEAARRLAAERRSSGQFVDQDSMKLRCKICGFIAVGDYEARAHAGGTGHKEFAPA